MPKDMCTSSYICPFCASHLSVNNKIVLLAKNKQAQRGLVLLSTAIGDYSVDISDKFKVEQGEKLELHCGICQHSLKHATHDSLCQLIRLDEQGKEHTVLFSRKYGEQCTFHIKGEKATSYGEHAIRFQDPEWFLQTKE